ncbi:hypothetical protein HY947_04335 [Candidatus Gottesmanbacteria bacterium]|nr:hypothetical protein [Candidatus Gottesmanbacteria bacterium]
MNKLPKDIKKNACLLRVKGNSFRDIAKKLSISLGSSFYYTRHIHLRKSQKIELQLRGYRNGIEKISPSVRAIFNRKGGINTPHHFQIQYSRKHLLQLLIEFATKHKRIPTKRDFYSHYGSYYRTFDSWNSAIREAGFSPNPVLFAKKFIAQDGHKCDSFSEKIIDDWLSTNKIPHERNVPYPQDRFTADFKIGKTLIEFFGLQGQLKRYDALMKKKLKMIQKYKLKVISLYPKDLFPHSHLNTLLGNKLRKYKNEMIY